MIGAFRADLAQMSAYVAPIVSDMIKLDAMENPYPTPKAVLQAFAEALPSMQLNRYPDASAATLRRALAADLGVNDEIDIIPGNGSDELIQLLVMAQADDATVLAPMPAFVMYEHTAHWLHKRFVPVPLAEDFSLDLAATLAAIDTHQPSLIFLGYPNNPTGNLYDTQAIDAIVDAAPGLVVIDEAYAPFAGGATYAGRLGHPKLLVLRTLSKFGLAGARLGYLAGPRDIMAQLDKLRMPYNVNVMSQQLALIALQHKATYAAQWAQLNAARAQLADALSARGAYVYPSATNFLLLRVADAPRQYAALHKAGIAIKTLHKPGTVLEHMLRVSIGTESENAALLAAWGQ